MIRSRKFYFINYAFGLILISFACGMFFDGWLTQNASFWPVILLIAILVVWFARFARLLWTQQA
jgi:hypothetical protein